jgi:gliding motility-associated-like protein
MKYLIDFPYKISKSIPFKLLIIVILLINSFKSSGQCNPTIQYTTTSGTLSGCAPFSVSFKDPNITFSRTWDFGDGKPNSTSTNPFHVFEGGKKGDTTYTVTLTKNCNGGVATQVVVNVYAVPKVNFKVDTTSVCAINDQATFTNLSDAGTYDWNFGDNTSSTQKNPVKTYSVGGLYDVALTVTNAKGCQNTYTSSNLMTVNSLPSPDFILDKYSGCAPLSVKITNTTDTVAVGIKKWDWTLNNDLPNDTTSNPGTVEYDIAGNKQLTLKVTSILGCKSSTSVFLNVITTPSAEFSTSSDVICSSDSLKLTYLGAAGPNATYLWSLNGGTSKPSSGKGPLTVNWPTGGVKTIGLTVTDSTCFSDFNKSVTVMISPKVTLSSNFDTICTAEPIKFDASPQSLVEYIFYKNNSEVQRGIKSTLSDLNILDFDTYYAIGKDAKGCSSVKSNLKTIRVKVKPVVTLSSSDADNIICEGDNVQFDGNPSNYKGYTFFNYSQSMQSGINSTFSTTSLKDNDSIFVEATNLNGCKKTSSNAFVFNVVEKLTKPVVQCANSTSSQINFTWDTIPGSTGYEVSINGGAFQSSSSSYSHLVTGLNSGDTIKVLVRAIGSYSCGNSVVSDTQVCHAAFCTRMPIKYFPYDTICKGETTVLKMKGFTASNYSVSWNGEAPTRDTTYIIKPNASIEVPVIIIDSTQLANCSPFNTKFKITVNQLPTVTLSSDLPTTNCLGGEALLTATPDYYDRYTFYNGNQIIQNNWRNSVKLTDIKDGIPVKVVATESGCTSISNIITNTVIQPLSQPIVNCGTSTTSSIEFKWDAVSGAIGYEVSVDGGNWITPTSGNNGLKHILNGLTPGSASYISIRAKGATICGNSNVSLQASCFTLPCTAITFNNTPDFSICQGGTANLSISGVSIPNYTVSWNTVNYNKVLSYSVKPKNDTIITVSVKNTNETNCPTVSKYTRVEVINQPHVSLSIDPSVVCNGDSVDLIASPVDYDNYKFYNGSALLYSGYQSTIKTARIKTGQSVKVVARNGSCTDTSNIVSVVVNKPLERPIINSGNITSSSIEFVWDSVPQATGYMISVDGKPYVTPSTGNLGRSHLISGLAMNTSKYAKVIALGVGACGNSDESDTIIRHTTGDIDSVCTAVKYTLTYHDSICDGDNFIARVTNINNSTSLLSWNGAFEDTISVYTIAPIKTDTLSVVIRRTDEPFCPGVKKLVRITVNPKPNVSLSSSISNDSICQGEEIIFYATPSGYENYKFSSLGSILQNSNNNEFDVSKINTSYQLEVEVTDDIGCIGNSSVFPMTMVAKPVVSLTSNAVNSGICIGSNLTLTASPAVYATYHFYDNTSIIQSKTTNSLSILNFSKSYNFSANAVHAFGCVGDTTPILPINLHQLPVVTLTTSDSDNSICEGQNFSITASPNYLTEFDFYDASNLLLQSSSNNIYTYTNLLSNKSTYVVAKDSNNCISKPTSTITVTVNPNPVMTSSNLLIICSNNTVEIPLQSSLVSTFQWQAADNPNVTGESLNNKNTATLKDTLNNLTTSQENVTYSVIPTSLLGCVGVAQQVNVKVNPTPIVSNKVDTICSGNNFFLAPVHQFPSGDLIPSNTTYTWPSPVFSTGVLSGGVAESTGVQVISQALTNSSNSNTNIIYTITPKSGATGNCSGKPFTYKVVVEPTPVISNLSVDSICSDISFIKKPVNGNPTASEIVPVNTLYTWSNPIILPNGSVTGSTSESNGTTEISGILTNQTLNFATVTYSVSPISGRCVGTNFLIPFVIKPVPKITNVLSKSFCSDTKVSVNLTSDVSSSINWFADNQTNVSGETTTKSSSTQINDLLVNTTNSVQVVNYNITPTSLYNCVGETKTLAVQVNPKPYIKDISFSKCDADSIVYQPVNLDLGNIIPTDTKYTWKVNDLNPKDSLLGYSDELTPKDKFLQILNLKTVPGILNYKVSPISGDAGACIGDSFNIQISIFPIPDPKVEISKMGICRGEEINITTTLDETHFSNTTYSWNTGQTSKSFSIKPNQTTTYVLTATSNKCSSKIDSVHVEVDQVVPNANAGLDETICRGDSIELKATGGKTYAWVFDKSMSDTSVFNPKVAPYVTTEYNVYVTNDYCTSEAKVKIIIDRCLKELPFKIPQIYTPNGDGANDVWELIDVDYFTKSSLIIFNRWGEIVYEVGPYLNQWDGKNSGGDDLSDGTYYYVLDLGNGHELYKGFVVITR